ncbi:hypothetical protein ACFQ14_12375 [Pseudahrensia aquimaris]|uniref:Uncharacterized protein n=1 Tax=Pseudahrensia aquimaris TaxID=744461 RepID=A0ABW3FFF8_9HYPH
MVGNVGQEREYVARDKTADSLIVEGQLYVEGMKAYGSAALRGIFLLNGGGVLAILSYLGSTRLAQSQISDLGISETLYSSAVCFILGLALVVAANTFAYFNFAVSSYHGPNWWRIRNFILNGDAPLGETGWFDQQTTQISSVACALVALFLFVYGAIKAAKVLAFASPI